MSKQVKVSTNKLPTKQLHNHLYSVQVKNAPVAWSPLGSHLLLQIQQLHGNRYVQRLLTTRQESNAEISLVMPRQSIERQPTQVMGEGKVTELNLQMSRLREHRDAEPRHDPAKLSDADIEATNEFRSYMNPMLVWQSQLHLTREEALLACQLILHDLRQRKSILWKRDARAYALKAQHGHTIQTEMTTNKKGIDEVSNKKKVTTLCHRDFQTAMPSGMAQHCFVWGHLESIRAIPKNIQQKDTITYDNGNSGTMDPVPHKNTTCTTTFPDVDPEIVRQKYIELCNPKDYNLTSFNCCTCAYLALSAAGAKVIESDFPQQNQGMSLPKSYGSGWKKEAAESLWFNDIDELEQILDKNLSIEHIQKVPLQMKAKWIRDMIRGLYTTKNEGKIVLKLFKGTSNTERPKLYKQVESHEWSGDWREGVFSVDDDMVDALSRSQLNELRDMINAKQ